MKALAAPFASPALLVALALTAPPAWCGGDADEAEMRYASQPRVLGREAKRVGEWIDDIALPRVDGAGEDSLALSDVAGERGLVIALRDADCPLSRRYAPRVKRLRGELEELGLGLLLVGLGDEEACAKDRESYGFEGPYVLDAESELARELVAQTSTEVFVLDAARTLVYRGMIDDQYGLGFAKPQPRHTYLMDAVRQVAAGDAVAVEATQAQGCLLETRDQPAPWRETTYHNRISRILQRRCESCHRPGAAGPFTMSDYESVSDRLDMIAWAVEEQTMPPWFAEEGHVDWRNDSSLTEDERDELIEWIEMDAPEGEPEHAPLARRWTDGWTIGEPDLVVPLPEAVTVPAEGVVDYLYFYAKTDFEEDRWVKALEIRAGAPEVVHHVLVFVEEPAVLEAMERGDRSAERRFQGGLEGYFACTVPGQDGLVFPPGVGKRLPAGAWLKFQMHYTPNGREQVDQSELGLIFYGEDEEVHTEVQTNSAANTRFAIPPGAKEHEVTGSMRFDEDAQILSLFPHTHLRGTGFRYELVYPDRRREELLSIPRYDFNWQLNYELNEPLTVPKGTRLRATGWYDNSADNPNNPNPKATVYFGEQTFEEMMIGYVNWIPASAGVSATEAAAETSER